MAQEQDYYAIIGASKDSDQETIKQSYRKLAREYHPDRVANLGQEFKELAARKMESINEAYQVLSDADKRREYDRALATGRAGASRPAAQPQSAKQPQKQERSRENAAEDLMRDQARALMMMESSFFQMRDAVKLGVNLGWEETKSADFLSILSGKTFTARYYLYFKSIHTLSPRDFTALLQKLRSLDSTTKTGLLGNKKVMLVIMFANMEDGHKVEELWKRFNDESMDASKSQKKYVTLINATTSKTFGPPDAATDKNIQAIVSKLRLSR